MVRIRPILKVIHTLLLSKPGADTLAGKTKNSLEERRMINLLWAQWLAKVVVLLVCLILGVGLDSPWLGQVILML